ncbi:phage tail protein [Shimia sp. Alg240-R146]|uniref:phage tail protein n=1 Tax=Shimia sp. Alg240-R146 TaxID=2993449 RepID=UPI0022E69B8B|nr:tail fiber protein [Shimia sp. Alg240-R146]
MLIGFNFCPRGWANADGQLLPINQNQSLYSLLGTQFGGDGRTTFGLPDLRGRAPIAAGQGTALPYYQVGAMGGQEYTSMTVANMPTHNHQIVGEPTTQLMATTSPTASNAPGGNMLGTFGANEKAYATSLGTPQLMHNRTVDLNSNVTFANTGSGRAQNNMQPFGVLKYCIATTGDFPSRN